MKICHKAPALGKEAIESSGGREGQDPTLQSCTAHHVLHQQMGDEWKLQTTPLLSLLHGALQPVGNIPTTSGLGRAPWGG